MNAVTTSLSLSNDLLTGTEWSPTQLREFFHATPAEAKAHLAELTGELLEFEEVPEALEYRQGLKATAAAA